MYDAQTIYLETPLMFVGDLNLFKDDIAIYFLILNRLPVSLYYSLATVTPGIMETHDRLIGICIPCIYNNISKTLRACILGNVHFLKTIVLCTILLP